MTGITYEKSRNRYRARITHEGSLIDLGRFDTELKAKRAVSKKRKELALWFKPMTAEELVSDFRLGFEEEKVKQPRITKPSLFDKLSLWLKQRNS